METIGSGKGVAALFNARARHFAPRAVRALTEALPDARVLISEDLAQARRHAANLVATKPHLVLAGGGDGSVVRLLNLLRDAGMSTLPTIGVFKLGTGNAWARVSGAGNYYTMAKTLPSLPLALPTRRFDLVEVEGQLCHFAGVGWDARLLNDYLRNLDKRSSQLIGSRFATRLHKGLPGYLYSLFRITVPEEMGLLMSHGQPRVVIENLGDEPVFTLDSRAQPIPFVEAGSHRAPRVLHDGLMSVAAASTTPEWGFGFRAFPYAQAAPGMMNLRVYDKPALQAVRVMGRLWKGLYPEPGMHDLYAKHVRMTFSRPMPFQIGGDGLGLRERIEYRVADQGVNLLMWGALR